MDWSCLSWCIVMRCLHQDEQVRAAVEEYASYAVFELDYPREGEPTVHIGRDEQEAR